MKMKKETTFTIKIKGQQDGKISEISVDANNHIEARMKFEKAINGTDFILYGEVMCGKYVA